jgi:hypothetical protein
VGNLIQFLDSSQNHQVKSSRSRKTDCKKGLFW